jgi:methionyl-tRNA formyltransferase
MGLALFASGPVGLRVVEVMASRAPSSLAIVVLDEKGDEALNDRIQNAAGSAPVWRTGQRPSPELMGQLRALEIDLGILAWWPYIVGEDVLAAARLGFLNFHPSLLPHDRGKDPNFWALVERAPFGVTLHFAEAGVDAGDIAFQRELSVGWTDTGETLHRRAAAAIVELFEDHIDDILAFRIPRRSQVLDEGSFHRRSELESASRVELDAPTTARAVLDLLRARTFAPHPGAWFEDGGEQYEVRVSITPREPQPRELR